MVALVSDVDVVRCIYIGRSFAIILTLHGGILVMTAGFLVMIGETLE